MAQHKHSTDPDKIGIHRVKRGHASSTFRGSFDYKGYIQLRFRVDRFGKIDGATIIPKIEKDITVLLDGAPAEIQFSMVWHIITGNRPAQAVTYV